MSFDPEIYLISETINNPVASRILSMNISERNAFPTQYIGNLEIEECVPLEDTYRILVMTGEVPYYQHNNVELTTSLMVNDRYVYYFNTQGMLVFPEMSPGWDDFRLTAEPEVFSFEF